MEDPAARMYRRFDAVDRVLHVCLMMSFFGLAISGLPLFFSTSPWAGWVAHALGGFRSAALIHRGSALLLFAVFASHLGRVGRRLVAGEWGVLWGPDSLTPQPRDLVDLYGHFKWFIGRGARPHFGRWTYWEKFDYLAVFWGMGIIGASGLMLWFPTLFARVLPGWAFNVALLVHGEEALLAVVFIFTVHFFNTHMRPEKFPMDLVIFTGRVTERELRDERPKEYDGLVASGALETQAVGPPPAWVVPAGRTLGALAVGIGFTIVALIVLSLVAG